MSSYVQYTGNGSTQTFSVTFPYLSRTHVVVSVDSIVKLSPLDYEWLSDASISFHTAPTGVITIRRITERDTALVSFENGSVLTEDELNTAHLQNFYITQELQDALDGYINGGVSFYTSGSLVGTTVQDRIDAAAGEVLNSALLASLQSRYGDIDMNAENVLGLALRVNVVEDAIDALTGTGGTGVITLIANETNARILADEAIVEDVALIGARSGDNLSFILDLDTVKVSASESLATRLSYLTTQDSGNAATAASILNLTASPTSALVSSINSLTTTVGGHTSTIGTHTSSINGIAAQYVVKATLTGPGGAAVVSGFGLMLDANTGSEFYILANKFAVVDPAAPTTSKVPFVITGGVCYMQNVVIQDALIQNLTVGKLTTGSLVAQVTQNADWFVGTGRIIWDNGTYLKASGTGFGTSNQFIEWYGPRPSGGNLALCSEANAVSYLKTNGDAYFGGTLSAGLLKNSATTSSLTTYPEITVGPFGTNGGAKTVVVSYQSHDSYSNEGAGGSGTNSGTVSIYRKIGTGAEALWTTFALTGSWFAETGYGWAEPGMAESSLGGSVTLTDNVSGTGDRTYRAVVTAKSMQIWDGYLTSQRLSIISTEE